MQVVTDHLQDLKDELLHLPEEAVTSEGSGPNDADLVDESLTWDTAGEREKIRGADSLAKMWSPWYLTIVLSASALLVRNVFS